MKRNTFSFGGCGANVSSHHTGAVPTFLNECTQPTPVHTTSPAFTAWPGSTKGFAPGAEDR